MFSSRELERYKRQMMLFGNEGQEQLKRSTVVIAGAGGIGSPVALYLAVAGIGTIKIVDNDVVEQSNLNRQILHTERDIGRRKVDSAAETLQAVNPDINVWAIHTTIDAKNAKALVGNAHGIVDAMDNFPTRYLLNDVAITKKIPLFHGAIRGFYGQATTIIPGKSACLRCIFPKAPPQDVFPVIGVTPGVIGAVQATEVIKYLLKRGDLLTDRLFIWDGMRSRAEDVCVEKNPACESCGTKKGSRRKRK